MDSLQTILPLTVVDRGEAGNMSSERLFCISCRLPADFRRRAARAGGLDQPVGVHRFCRHGCGARVSLLLHEHFYETYHLQLIIPRPPPATAQQPTAVVADARVVAAGVAADMPSAQPAVRRFPVDQLFCTGCGEPLGLTLYDPVDHTFHAVEYSCARCQDIYAGTVTHCGAYLQGTLMRRRADE